MSPNTTERFTPRARSTVVVAEGVSRQLKAQQVEPQHVLSGLIQSPGVARDVLAGLGLETSDIQMLTKQMPSNAGSDPSLRLSPAVKKLLVQAVDEARRLSHTQVGTGHLLLALLRQAPIASRLLPYLDLSMEEMLALIRQSILYCADPDDAPRLPQAKREVKSGAWYQMTSRVMKLMAIEPLPPSGSVSDDPLRTERTAQLTMVNSLLDRHPDHARLYIYRGRLHVITSDWDAAIADYSEAIRLKPNLGSGYYNRGLVRYDKKDYEGTVADLTRAIQLSPHHPTAYIFRAMARRHLDEYDLARADFEEALRINAQNILVYKQRGVMFLANCEFEQAIADFDQVLNVDPTDALTRDNRGTARAHTQDYDGAEADFREVFRLKPDVSRSHANLGWLCLLRGDYDGAIKYCDEAIRLDPTNGVPYYSRGTARAAKGDQAGAVADYRQSLAHWKTIKGKLTARYEREMLDYIQRWGG